MFIVLDTPTVPLLGMACWEASKPWDRTARTIPIETNAAIAIMGAFLVFNWVSSFANSCVVSINKPYSLRVHKNHCTTQKQTAPRSKVRRHHALRRSSRLKRIVKLNYELRVCS
jgi:hypothetical protein